MSFFLKKGSGRKRKQPVPAASKKTNRRRRNGDLIGKPTNDEEIPSSEADSDLGDDVDDDDVGLGFEDEFSLKETAEEKRLRLAKAYLEEIEKEERERAADESLLNEAVSRRLQEDNLEEIGKLKREVAHLYKPIQEEKIRFLRDKVHNKSITCLAISPDGQFLYSGSKDAGIIKWRIENGEKVVKVKRGRIGVDGKVNGHVDTINAIAVSSDGKHMATGGMSRQILIWDTTTMNVIHVFKGHKDSITGLAFRKKHPTLYSCSSDRLVKVWNLTEMAYVETLMGHQDGVTGIDVGLRERPVTSGGRDGTLRAWKIVEESQLIFNGPASSIDGIKLINEDHFITCGEDGHISVWSMMKKKPLCTVQNAHGLDSSSGVANWISAIASLPMTDLIASGSCDGFIRIWKCGENFRHLEEIQKLPMKGFVNALSFTTNGRILIAGIGQEHRLGRWQRFKEAKNGIAVIPLDVIEEKNQSKEDNDFGNGNKS